MLFLLAGLCTLAAQPGTVREQAVTLSQQMLSDYGIPRHRYNELKSLNIRYLGQLEEARQQCLNRKDCLDEQKAAVTAHYHQELRMLLTAQQFEAYLQNPPARLHAGGFRVDPRVYLLLQNPSPALTRALAPAELRTGSAVPAHGQLRTRTGKFR